MTNEKTEENDGATWGRTRRMQEFRRDVIDQYKLIHGGNVIQGIGFYYGTVEVQWLSIGVTSLAPTSPFAPHPPFTTNNFSVSVTPGNPVIDQTFSLGIGDISRTWFSTTGTPHILNASDTNLQNPGMNLFADEVFIIEAVSARVRGLRIGFSATDIATMLPAPTGNTLAMLQGNQMLRDQFGLVVPAELFNQYSDEFRMVRTLEEVATLHFKWTDNMIGGSGKIVDVNIDSFLNVTKEQRDVKSTSGGAMTLDLPSGYIWCLDKMWQPNEESGGNGIFDCELQLNESVSYPYMPISVFGSPAPVSPLGIALYWEIRLFGTSLLPGQKRFRTLASRIER